MESNLLLVEKTGRVAVIRVQENKLYQHTINPFRDRLMSLIDSGERRLAVDLSKVDVMNSSALGVLILAWDKLSKSEGKMVIVGLSTLMAELFDRMKLNLLFPVVRTEEEALAVLEEDKKNPAK